MLLIQTNNNPLIYSQTTKFKSSRYCKGNISLSTNKKLSQNNTGLYFEQEIIKPSLNNVLNKNNTYKKLNNTIYNPDLETNLSVISCKVQETGGTAYQKIVCELIDLEYISKQTDKYIVLLFSDYSYQKYFYCLDVYLNQINRNVKIMNESYFLKNIKLYD